VAILTKMDCQLILNKIYLVVIMVLFFVSTVHAVPAAFFGTDTPTGESTFRSIVTSADASAVFYEYHFTAAHTTSQLNPVAVSGSDGSTVYVKITRAGSVEPYDDNFSHTHDGYSTYYYDSFSVSAANWTAAVTNGVKFEFFSDISMATPTTINAIGTFTNDWGDHGFNNSNPTPTENTTGTAIFTVFTASDNTTSTQQIGNITENAGDQVKHFVAEIDDSNYFTSVTIVPNGHGEIFGVGGYLLFSKVAIGSVPSGSGWTPSVPPEVTFNPANGATGIGVGSNITLTFTERIRNLDNSNLTDSNIDALITLKNANASGSVIPFDATINSTYQTITIDPTSDFASVQVVYVAIGATVEDFEDNSLTASNATFTCAAGGVPTASFSPAAGETNVSTSTNITISFDESVRNTDDSPITNENVDALVTLKNGNTSGANIGFDATISGNTITIDPTSNFTLNQVVFVEIAAVEDESGNQTTASNITFTTDNSCTATEVANSNYSVTGSVTGTSGGVVAVTCDTGYSGGGNWTCGTDGTFTGTSCTDINECSGITCGNGGTCTEDDGETNAG
ncbi:uncharacterized protein METZ01_LOCUS92777, partial [marine metagenome]